MSGPGVLRHAAAPRAFGVVGFGSVLVEEEQGSVGVVLEFLGSDPDRGAHQVGFDLVAGEGVDRSRDALHRLAHHLDVFAVDQSVGLSERGARQHRLERFSGQCAAWSQLRCLVESAAGLAGRDSPPDRQHVAPGLGAHLLGGGLGLQAGQHAVALGGQLAGERFEFVERPDQLGLGERIDGQRGHAS